MKNKFLLIIKESYAGIFISLCLSFMLLFYEPLNIFATNINDFWFDIYTFFPIVLYQFILSFLVLAIFFVILSKINKKLYAFFVVCFLIGMICSYIQGNFLIGSLPAIDGNWIDFDIFKTEKIISILLWLIVSGVVLFSLYKFKFNIIEKVSKYSSLIIIVMLSCSMLSFFTIDGFFTKKTYVAATYSHFNEMSKDKNFIIFLLDATDSTRFSKEVEKLGKTKTLFKDFTYFPDTLGGYPFTKNSIPLILGGKWYKNDGNFTNFYTKTIDESPLFEKLEKENYNINIYEDDLNSYNSNNYERFKNVELINSIDIVKLVREEARIILYKYLPFQLKWRSHIENLDFMTTRKETDNELFTRFDIPNYNKIKNDKLDIIEGNNFQYIHLEGAHNPQRYDINLNIVKNGVYEGNLDACITILETYFNKLKENDVYDNSVIVVMADHGYSSGNYGRQNPILYIKGINEKHDYKVSKKKVSYDNLMTAFSQLIDGDSSSKLFDNLDNSERKYIFYDFHDEENMREQVQTGYAWDLKTMKDTGNKYKR